MDTKTIKRFFSPFLFIGIAGGIFYFMFRKIAVDWPIITSFPWEINWASIILSSGLSGIANILNIKAAHILCEVLGGRISFLRFLYISCITRTGRYLPGRLWHLVGFTLLINQEGVKKSVSIILPVLYQGLMVGIFWLTGLFLCGPFIIARLLPESLWFASIVTIVLFLTLLFLPFFSNLLNYLINLRYKEIKNFRLPQKGYYTILGLLTLSGLIYSGAFFIFASGLIEFSVKDAPFIGGSFLLSYVIGWMVFIVPGGLGVREGVLAFLLSQWIPLALSNIVALSARVWMVGVEFIILLGVWIWVSNPWKRK
jgi:hypothetical protein